MSSPTMRQPPALPPLRLVQTQEFRTVQSWRAYCRAHSTSMMPPRLSRQTYDRLSPIDRRRYNRLRTGWHANLPFVRTAMADALMDDLQMVLENNALTSSPRSRPGVLVSGDSQMGKTTTVIEAAAEFEGFMADLVAEADIDDRILADAVPVAWVTCTSKTTIATMCLDLLIYFGDPIPKRYSDNVLVRKVKDCLYQCDTKLLVIDEVSRLKLHRENDQDVSDFIRDLMLSPATIVGTGADVRKSKLLGEGNNYLASSGRKSLATQTTHRFTLFELGPFDDATSAGLADWRQVLTDLQQQLLLLDAPEDMLQSLSPYLYERSRGIIGFLINLLQRGCAEAIATGAEVLSESLLADVPISVGADDPEDGEISSVATGSRQRKTPRRKGRNPIYDS